MKTVLGAVRDSCGSVLDTARPYTGSHTALQDGGDSIVAWGPIDQRTRGEHIAGEWGR